MASASTSKGLRARKKQRKSAETSESDDDSDYNLSRDDSDFDSSSETSEEYETTDPEDDNDEPLSPDELLAMVRRWCLMPDNDPKRPYFAFTGNGGPSIGDRVVTSALDYFQMFFDDDIMCKIVSETNRNAEDYIASKPLKTYARANEWKELTVAELWIYLALVFLMGIIDKPTVASYWSRRKSLQTPFFGDFMSANRFLLITKFLHFANESDLDQESHPCWKLRKIWPIYEFLQEKFSSLFQPGHKVSIDESLMLHKGNLGWKQYIPAKRARFGIKFYILCDAETGYIWRYVIYTGAGTNLMKEYKDELQTVQIVLTLMHTLLGKGHCLIADNFYMSPQLSDKLLKHKTDSYGTVRSTRKEMPPELTKSALKKGETLAYQRGKLMAMKWVDKKDIYLLSTHHNSALAPVPNEKKNVPTMKPELVLDYNLTMGGVDRADQNLTYYESVRKRTKIYYKKIFRHLLDQCIFNAFTIHKWQNKKHKKLLDFRLALVEEILAKYFDSSTMTPKTGRKSSVSNVVDAVRLAGRHFPEDVPSTSGQKNPCRRCVVCCSKTVNGKKVRRETRYWCSDCQVALCVTPCFRDYHTKTNY
jgi:hypothetical protein